ncbi:MAG: hypothetical protein CBB71_17110, partial [Rhodopirellula sp. TMED11]
MDTAKRYLVTGAAGFIASQVCQQLLDQGHQVVGIDNLNDAGMEAWRPVARRNAVRSSKRSSCSSVPAEKLVLRITASAATIWRTSLSGRPDRR